MRNRYYVCELSFPAQKLGEKTFWQVLDGLHSNAGLHTDMTGYMKDKNDAEKACAKLNIGPDNPYKYIISRFIDVEGRGIHVVAAENQEVPVFSSDSLYEAVKMRGMLNAAQN